jgi:hypothetical protein
MVGGRFADRLICRTLAKRKTQMRNKGFNIFNVFFTSLVVAESQLGNNMLVFGSRDNGLWGRSEGSSFGTGLIQLRLYEGQEQTL